MGAPGTLAIKVLGDISDFQGKMGTAQKVLIGIGAAVGTAGIAALRMGDDYDDAADSIRTATGKTGAVLAGLEQSFKNVAGRVKEDIGLVAQVMGDLAVRTGLTGQPLEDLTQKVIEFSRVTGTDAVANTALVTRLFGDWSVATGDQATTLDELLRASQATGLGVDALMQTVVQFGAPLRLLGFTMEESIALLGKWEKEGVNTETMLQGLKFSVKTLAQEGVPASEMADTLRVKIEAIGKSTDPVSDAIKLFGLRAGPDLAAAILEGRFSVDDLIDTIENGSETVRDAAADTRDFGDGFAELKNKIKVAIGPIMADFAGLADAMGNAIYLLPVFGGALGKVVAAAASTDVIKNFALSGGVSGRAFGLGFAAAAVFAVPMLAKELGDKSFDAIQNFLGGANRTDFQNIINSRMQQAGVEAGAALGESAASTVVPSFQNGLQGPMLPAGWGEQIIGPPLPAGWGEQQGRRVGEDFDLGLMDGLRSIPDPLGPSVDDWNDRLEQFRQANREMAWGIGNETPGEFSQGLRAAFDTVRTAFTDLKDLMKNTLSPAAQEAELIGIATSKRLAKALDDNRPEVRAAAQQVALDTIAQLHRLAPGSAEIGKLSMQLLASATEAEKPAIRDAINAIVSVVDNTMSGIPPTATSTANSFVDRFTRAIRAGRKDVEAAIEYSFGRTMRGQSPPPEGPLHDIDKGGWNVADAWVRAFRNRMAAAGITESLQRIGAQAARAMERPDMPLALARVDAGGTGGYAAASITVNAYGQDDVERQIRRALRREQLRNSLQAG